jgi:hypothetical protein
MYQKEKAGKGKERKGTEGAWSDLVGRFLSRFPTALSPRASLRFVGTR